MIFRFAVFLSFLIFTIEAKKYSHFSEAEHWQEFEEFLKWKKAKEMGENSPEEIKYEKHQHHEDHHNMYKSTDRDRQLPVNNPPPIDQAALMARYIVNQAGKKIRFFFHSNNVFKTNKTLLRFFFTLKFKLCKQLLFKQKRYISVQNYESFGN